MTWFHNQQLWDEFKRVTRAYDRLRDESITELVPELANLMDGQGKTGQAVGWLALNFSRSKWLTDKIRNRFFG